MLDMEEPWPCRPGGEEDGPEDLRSSLMGSRFGCVSTAGLGTVEVRSIHNGRKSAFASCWMSESSSVDETVT